MNRALLVAAGFITGMTALSISTVGDTVCGQVNWTSPVTIAVSLLLALLLGYLAGTANRATSEVRDQLVEVREAFEAQPPTSGSTYQLAAHYYNLVNDAKPVLGTAIEKLAK